MDYTEEIILYFRSVFKRIQNWERLPKDETKNKVSEIISKCKKDTAKIIVSSLKPTVTEEKFKEMSERNPKLNDLVKEFDLVFTK